MVILRQRLYSRIKAMIDKITAKLDKAGIDDYDIVSRIPGDTISITADLGNLKIYLPRDFEFSQYDIDDFIRDMVGYLRTKTILDRNIYVMSVLGGKLTEEQYFKLVKHIIEENEFIAIINDEI